MQKIDMLDYPKGIVNEGNQKRIMEVMARAEQGEKLCIGFIGGSITQGSLSSTPQTCYAYLVYKWWCETFPQAEFTYVNAGIGGTTSQFGVARVEDDLLSRKPDFVVIEFSVNDEDDAHFMETYEGLVRRIYGAPQQPAMLLVHNIRYDDGKSAERVHECIARHYDLPAVSMKSTIYAEVLAGRIQRQNITPDNLHPNDAGHMLVASVITYLLKQVKGVCGENAVRTLKEQNVEEIPEPLTENAYEYSRRYQNNHCTPILQGFVSDGDAQNGITDCFKHGWIAEKCGDVITFFVEGSCIAVQYRKSVKQPAPIAEVIVDGDEKKSVRLDANFDEEWGDKLELVTVLEHGETRTHDVQIRLVETHEDDAVPFYLVSVIAS